MSKARDLADSVSTGGILEDGAVSVSEISDLTVTAEELNNVAGVNSDVQTQLDLKAPLASPTFTGDVGIGTSSPARKLQVESDGNRVVSVKHTDGSSAFVTFSDNATTDDGQVRIGAVGNDLVGLASSVEGMRLTSTGLGVGTSVSPARKLQVESTDSNRVVSVKHTAGAYAYVTFSDNTTTDDGTVRVGALGNDLLNFVGGAERLRITSNGEFGIGGANYGTAGQVLTSGGSGAAPTWADAAGGGSARDFVASGTIANGNVVKLNSDGTVSITVGTDSIGGNQLVTGISGNDAKENKDAVFDPTTNQIILTYSDPNVSSRAQYVVGKVVDQTITWGTPATWETSVVYDNWVKLGPSGTVLFMCITGANCILKVYQINSDQTLTYKSDFSMSPQTNTTLDKSALVYNPANSYAYCIFTDSTTLRAHTIYIDTSSNYSLSQRDTAYLTTYNLGSQTYGVRATYDANSDRCVFIWYNGSSTDEIVNSLYAGTGAQAGQGIQTGNEVVFGPASGNTTHDIIYSPAAQKCFLIYRETNNNNRFVMKTVSGSGVTLTLSSEYVIDAGNGALGYAYQIDTAYSSVTEQVYLSGRFPASNNYGYSFKIGWSSNAPVISSSFNFYDDHTRANPQVAAGAGSNVIYIIGPLDGTWKLLGRVHDTEAVESAYGIANASVTNGQTVEVVSIGSIVDNQTGLTVGAKYYYNADGAISTTGSKELGVAVSSTELLITGVVL